MLLGKFWRNCNRPIQCRFYSSNEDTLLLTTLFETLLRSPKGSAGDEPPLELGASRYWALNSKSKYACIGAVGPINLSEDPQLRQNVRDLIDYENKLRNKVHIEIVKCPNILANQLLIAFPHRHLDRGRLQIVKLSYDAYYDKAKGKLDSLIAASYICKRLYDEGEFNFYSGAAVKNADIEIMFNIPRKFDHDKLKNLHVNLKLEEGYWKIDHSNANDIGIIYTEGTYDPVSLKKLLERRMTF